MKASFLTLTVLCLSLFSSRLPAAMSPGFGDNFEDGTINGSLWVVGGGQHGQPGDPGDWQYSTMEVLDPTDGYFQGRVWGPESGNTYGAEVWIQTAYNFNDGKCHIINFTWEPEFADPHCNHYFIQVTDGYLGAPPNLYWAYQDYPGMVNLLWCDFVHGGTPHAGMHFEYRPSIGKVTWSIRVNSVGIAQLYDGPGGTGSLLKEAFLDKAEPWYIRFMGMDGTSAGFPAGDAWVNLYHFSSKWGLGPIAEADGPYKGFVGVPIAFRAVWSRDRDRGRIVLYEWDWDNDGLYDEATNRAVSLHKWNEEFSGTVQLRVTDNDGWTNTDTATVVVKKLKGWPCPW